VAASSSAILVRRPRRSPVRRELAALLITHARPSTGILSHLDGGDAREYPRDRKRKKWR